MRRKTLRTNGVGITQFREYNLNTSNAKTLGRQIFKNAIFKGLIVNRDSNVLGGGG